MKLLVDYIRNEVYTRSIFLFSTGRSTMRKKLLRTSFLLAARRGSRFIFNCRSYRSSRPSCYSFIIFLSTTNNNEDKDTPIRNEIGCIRFRLHDLATWNVSIVRKTQTSANAAEPFSCVDTGNQNKARRIDSSRLQTSQHSHTRLSWSVSSLSLSVALFLCACTMRVSHGRFVVFSRFAQNIGSIGNIGTSKTRSRYSGGCIITNGRTRVGAHVFGPLGIGRWCHYSSGLLWQAGRNWLQRQVLASPTIAPSDRCRVPRNVLFWQWALQHQGRATKVAESQVFLHTERNDKESVGWGQSFLSLGLTSSNWQNVARYHLSGTTAPSILINRYEIGALTRTRSNDLQEQCSCIG